MDKNMFHVLSDPELIAKTRSAVEREREATLQVIEALTEVDRRRLWAALGYSSLFSYLMGEFQYDGGQAQRRVNAVYFCKAVPEAKTAIESGRVTLTSLSTLAQFVKNETRIQKKSYSIDAKRELLQQIEGKSVKQVEKLLVTIAPESIPRKEVSQPVAPNRTLISMEVDDEFMELLEELKRQLPQGSSQSDALKQAMRLALKRVKPSLNATPATASMPGVRTHLPRGVRQNTIQENGRRCAYVSPITGKRCEETRGLEVDHKIPIAKGGDSTKLTALCRAHNQQRAIEVFGLRKMAPYLGRL